MTKAELIAALKDFPDDMNVCLEVNGGLADLIAIDSCECERWISHPLPLDDEYVNEKVILLRGNI